MLLGSGGVDELRGPAGGFGFLWGIAAAGFVLAMVGIHHGPVQSITQRLISIRCHQEFVHGGAVGVQCVGHAQAGRIDVPLVQVHFRMQEHGPQTDHRPVGCARGMRGFVAPEFSAAGWLGRIAMPMLPKEVESHRKLESRSRSHSPSSATVLRRSSSGWGCGDACTWKAGERPSHPPPRPGIAAVSVPLYLDVDVCRLGGVSSTST